jgi:hypothetical protein
MRQGQLSCTMDMFIADLGLGLPRRQRARRFNDRQITSNPIQLVLDRERGDDRQVGIRYRECGKPASRGNYPLA